MSLVGNQEMFFRSVALLVHQVIHGVTPPFGVKDHSDGVCRCVHNLHRGKWSSFGYLRRWGRQKRLEKDI